MPAIRFLRQLAVLTAVYGCGELAVRVSGVPVPGSVAGMAIMLLLLSAGLIRTAWVEEAAAWLLNRLTLLFLPALVGLADYWPVVRAYTLPLLAVVFFSTLAVLLGAAGVTVLVGRRVRHAGG